MTTSPLRIAMWSGPRNLSTAMMRAFGSRPDTAIADEPFYAHFLKTTGVQHPGRAEVFAKLDSDWRKVADYLTGPVPDGKAVWYQKQMTHHVVGDNDLNWIGKVVNCFLIRHPKDVILSYQKIYPEVDINLLGCRQQATIFEHVRKVTGEPPIVIEADDIARNPEIMLTRLCERLGIPFTAKMLSWAEGPHPSDGVWGKYWYRNVMKTTGFHPFKEKEDEVEERHKPVYDECLETFLTLRAYKIR